MAFCSACGNPVLPEAQFCTVCGKKVTTRDSPTLSAPIVAVSHPIETSAAPSNIGPAETHSPIATRDAINETAIRSRRPIGVMVLAILAIPGAALSALVGFWALWAIANLSVASTSLFIQVLFWLIPAVGAAERNYVSSLGWGAAEAFAAAVICPIASYGLWKLREWGRIFAIVSIGLGLLHAVATIITHQGSLLWHLVAIGLEVWSIFYLVKPRVKQAFSA